MNARVVAMIAIGLLACAHAEKTEVRPPDVLFAEAREKAADRKVLFWTTNDCEEAIRLYRQIIDFHPFSQYATEAQLGIADCYFKDERWSEAAMQYKDFEALHPTHREIWRARFNLGLAYEALSLAYDLDQADTENAYYYFNRVATEPNPYRDEAARKAREQATKLASRIYYIGRFYEREKEYLSAVDRYQSLLRAYPDLLLAVETYKRTLGLYEIMGMRARRGEVPRPAPEAVSQP